MYQLGEAILSHPASDDAGSIHLEDTRTTRLGRTRDGIEHDADEETRRLFRVDDDEEGEEGEREDVPDGQRPLYALARGSSLSRRSDDQDDDREDARPRIIGLGHARARISRIDVATTALFDEQGQRHASVDTMTSGSGSVSKSENGDGLSAQAGAIIVRVLFLADVILSRPRSSHCLSFTLSRSFPFTSSFGPSR